MKNAKSHIVLNCLAIITGALFLMIPAIYNGYPLVNSDVATFLHSGFKPDTPFDRPITYGLLLRAYSLNGLSMWLVVFIQGLLMSWLIIRTTKHLYIQPYRIAGISTIMLLSLFTSLSWIVSELIADVYTSIALLTMFILLTGKEKKGTNLFLYFIYLLSIATHLSHLIIFTPILVLLLFLRKRFFDNVKQATRAAIVMLVLTLASIGIMGNAMSKSGHVFMTASMLDKGILKVYLDDNCAANKYGLCKHKDNLPNDINTFLWDANVSPLYLEGGWQRTKKEYSDINNQILTTPKYLVLFLKQSSLFSAKQAIDFSIGDGNTPFPEGSNVHATLIEYLPHEGYQFLVSKQNTGDLLNKLKAPNILIYVSVLIGLALIVVFWRRILSNRQFYLLFAISTALIIINIIDCATFSQVNGRYGCKVMWLIPFLALLSLFSKNKDETKLHEQP